MDTPTQADESAGIQFAMQMLKQVPRGNPAELETHITGVLIVFWGALWGSFGTEYARGFVEAQLRGMETNEPHETFVEPTVQ